MNYSMEINVTRNFTTEDLVDILSSSIIGGCDYWAYINDETLEYRAASNHLHENAKENDIICWEDVLVYMMENNLPIEVGEDEDDDGSFSKKHILTIEKFLNGIRQSIANGYWDGTDTCDVDGKVGNAIMQYALLGEVIYG